MPHSLDSLRRETLQELETTLREARRLASEADVLDRASSRCHQCLATIHQKRETARQLLSYADQLIETVRALGLGP